MCLCCLISNKRLSFTLPLKCIGVSLFTQVNQNFSFLRTFSLERTAFSAFSFIRFIQEMLRWKHSHTSLSNSVLRRPRCTAIHYKSLLVRLSVLFMFSNSFTFRITFSIACNQHTDQFVNLLFYLHCSNASNSLYKVTDWSVSDVLAGSCAMR